MSTIMTHDNTEQVTQTSDSSIELRALDIRNDQTGQISWQSSGDLTVALKCASGKVSGLPHCAEGGIVIIGLDSEDDSHTIHEVLNERTTGRDDLAVIEKAIEVLQKLRGGLLAASGGAR